MVVRIVLGSLHLSLPARGVWVEMSSVIDFAVSVLSLPARGVWVEIRGFQAQGFSILSLPARGVWVEIKRVQEQLPFEGVTPRTGSVG